MPPEIAAILVELARSIQRFGMYPEGHPARSDTSAQFTDHLTQLLDSYGSLPLEFTRSSILFEDQPTPEDNKLLAALARRINQHEIAYIEFARGLEEEEARDFLEAVAVQPGKTGEPLGAESPETLRRWPHINVETVSYDALSLARGHGDVEGTASEAPADWSERVEEGGQGDERTARASTADDESAPEEEVRKQISRLILNLDPETMAKLTRAMPAVASTGEVDPEMVLALTEVLREAAAGSGEDPPAALMRLLTKLGMHGEGTEGPEDPETMRSVADVVRQLGSGWNVADPNPGDYRAALTGLSRTSPVLSDRPVWVEGSEPDRVMKMSLELGEAEALTRSAARRMVDTDRIGEMLEILDDAPGDSEAVEAVWGWVAHPHALRRVLQREPVDTAILDRLLERMGMEAAETLFEALESTDSEDRRELLTVRLGELGSEVAPLAIERLGSDAPRTRRDMLTILRRVDTLPEDFSAAPYMTDADSRVRREAMSLGLAGHADREMVLTAALNDADPGIVRWGIERAEEDCPPEVLPYLIALIFESSSPSALRLNAIRALRTVKRPEALQALVRLTWKRRFLWFYGLVPKSAEMLEALRVLSECWQQDEKAGKILARAARSSDAQVKAVARKGGGG